MDHPHPPPGRADVPARPAGPSRVGALVPRLGPVGLALLPLLIPLLRRGGPRWLGLGAGLAVLALLLALPRRWPASVRWAAVLGVNGVGFGVVAASFLLTPYTGVLPTVQGAPEDLPQLSPVIPGIGMVPRPGGAVLDTALPGQALPLGGTIDFAGLRPAPLARGPGADNALRLVGRVRRWLAFAADPASGSAFASTPEGLLRHYSYPGFRLRRTYRLGQPAYRLVLDGRRGLLHAAVSDPDVLRVGPLGEVERARGDLWTLDVKPLLAGKVGDRQALRPTATVRLQARVVDLLRSPDGRHLYYLALTPRVVRVGRVDALRGEGDAQPVRAGAALLRAAPDGKALYLLTGGGVLILDPHDLRVTRPVTVPGPVSGMAAGDGGRIFLAYRNNREAEVYAVDVNQLKVEGCWAAPLRGGLELVLHPDQKGFFLGNSAVAGRRVLFARLPDDLRRPADVVGEARSDAAGVLGGSFSLTPDGRFLVDSGGKIYRTGGWK